MLCRKGSRSTPLLVRHYSARLAASPHVNQFVTLSRTRVSRSLNDQVAEDSFWSVRPYPLVKLFWGYATCCHYKE